MWLFDLLKKDLFSFMCVYVQAHVHVCACEGQKRNPLELELQSVVRCLMWVLWTKLLTSGRVQVHLNAVLSLQAPLALPWMTQVLLFVLLFSISFYLISWFILATYFLYQFLDVNMDCDKTLNYDNLLSCHILFLQTSYVNFQ